MDLQPLTEIRQEGLSAWLANLADAPRPPYSFRLVTDGRTHLTYQVTGDGGRAIGLRRAPRDHATDQTADAMDEREYRLVGLLAQHGIPVPRPLARCRDAAVAGAPFSVLEWIEGRSIGDAEAARAIQPPARAALGAAFMGSLAAVHRLDLQSAGLEALIRASSYVDRQVRAWRDQALAALATSPLPVAVARQLSRDLDRLADVIIAEQPPAADHALLHGDYRLENVIISDRGEVRAIVDWELAAVGDRLADVAYAVLMWDPVDSFGRTAPTSVAGFCTARELVGHYAVAAGQPVDRARLDFYLGLAAWRAACIGAVVLARYAAGEGAGVPITSSRAVAYLTRYRDRTAESLAQYVSGRTSGGA